MGDGYDLLFTLIFIFDAFVDLRIHGIINEVISGALWCLASFFILIFFIFVVVIFVVILSTDNLFIRLILLSFVKKAFLLFTYSLLGFLPCVPNPEDAEGNGDYGEHRHHRDQEELRGGQTHMVFKWIGLVTNECSLG